MRLLVIFLAEYKYLEKILEKFKELKISGVTILDSSGVGRTSLHRQWIPAVASLHKLWEREGDPSKTLFAVTDSEETALKAIDALKEIFGDLNKAETALAFMIPIENVTGLITIE